MTTRIRAHAGAVSPFPILCALLAALLAFGAGAPSEHDAAEATAADLQDAVTLASQGGAQ